jgi:hypothetical protein
MESLWKGDKSSGTKKDKVREIPVATEIIKIQRLRWFEHLMKMNKTRMAKLVHECVPFDSVEAKKSRPTTI